MRTAELFALADTGEGVVRKARRATPSIRAARIIRSRFSPAMTRPALSGSLTTAESGRKQSVKVRGR